MNLNIMVLMNATMSVYDMITNAVMTAAINTIILCIISVLCNERLLRSRSFRCLRFSNSILAAVCMTDMCFWVGVFGSVVFVLFGIDSGIVNSSFIFGNVFPTYDVV